MTDDVRISVGLPGHPKTKKLRRRLGGDGCWALITLFLWTGSQRWDGSLRGMSDEDIELAADWEGAPGAFVSALLEVGFLDGDAAERSIHDWQEHNPYAASKGARIEKGRQAADARWNGRKARKASPPDATSMPTACHEHATSIAEQCPPAPAPAPTPAKPSRAEAKATVEPAARQPDRFPEFWAVYPNKQGKQEAWKRWRKDKLDGIADQIIGHVRTMIAMDDGWQRGYEPMGSTYLNQQRWTDVPRGPPQASQPNAAPGKAMQAIIELEGLKNGLAGTRNHHRAAEAAVLETPGLPLLGNGDWDGGRLD